jgi:hypothetical protein
MHPYPNARLEPAYRDLFAPIRNRPGHRPEDIMFIYLFLLLKKALERAEHSRRDAYLASAVDIGELERRMHSMDVNG